MGIGVEREIIYNRRGENGLIVALIICVGVIYFMGSLAVKFLERFHRSKYGADFLLMTGGYVVFIWIIASLDILFGSLHSRSGEWLLSSRILLLSVDSIGYHIQYSDALNLFFALLMYFVTGTLIYFMEVRGRRLLNDKYVVNPSSKNEFDLISISSEGFRVLYWWHMTTALLSTYLLYSITYEYSIEVSVRTIPIRFIIIIFWMCWTVLYYFKFSDRMKEQYYERLFNDSDKHQEIQLIIQRIYDQGEYIIKGREVTEELLQCISSDVFYAIGFESVEKLKLSDEIKLFFSPSFKRYYRVKTVE